MTRLAGKTTLVIGGTRGIGRGIVEAFGREGSTALLAGRDTEAGAAVVAAVAATGGKGEFVRCDALDLSQLEVTIKGVADLLREIHFEGQREQDRLIAELGKQNPLGRVGTVEEIAAAAVYLASDEAAFVTGANLVVDGGFSI